MSIELRFRLVPASLLCGLLLACGDDDGGDDGGPSSTTGTIALTVSPPVIPLDPDGFAVSLNGGADQAVPESGELWLEDLPAGSHEVALTDVDEPCVVPGDNPRTITVAAGDTAFVNFRPVCTGAIKVSVSPSESLLDPDGFAVSLDGGAEQALPENGELWLEGLPAGIHEVTLTDVDEPCVVSGDNPRTITVPAGDTAFVAFNPVCTGAIKVTVSPPDSPFDPDGFTVSLDGGADQALPQSGELWLENLPAGSHQVALTDLDEPCVVPGPYNPLMITVAAGDTVLASFSPVCSAAIRVSVHPFESSFDPDGFTVSLDGGPDQALPEGGVLLLENLPLGFHEVALTDVGEACGVSDRNPRRVNLVALHTAFVDFHPFCGNPGDIVVHTFPRGGRPPRSYSLLLDGVEYTTIGFFDEAILANVEPGDHTVTLSAASVTCGGDRTQTVTVVEGKPAHVDFIVRCEL